MNERLGFDGNFLFVEHRNRPLPNLVQFGSGAAAQSGPFQKNARGKDAGAALR